MGIGTYIKSKRRLLVMLGCFAAVFTGIFSLYELPLSVILYASLLCAVVGLIFGICDYITADKKLRALRNAREAVCSSANTDGLPESNLPIDNEYRELVEALTSERRLIEVRSNKEKSELVDYYTLWTHQIKTPISAMRLILQGEDTETSRELEAQLFATERYVEMALIYMRTEAGGMDYVFREYKLDTLIKQVIRKYASMFIRKGLALDFKPCECRILTDERWFCFVLEQIVSNAVKYTMNGKVSIYTENANTLVIRDTGIGIAAEDIPRVFERGFTGYNGRQDKRATGIGLFLTKRVLAGLNHSITLMSEPDRGTEVRIIFAFGSDITKM